MPHYFIEMGQGVIAKGNLRVTTSPLYSCTLIAGYNKDTDCGGAFHYPAKSFKDVKDDMNSWAKQLKPTSIKLVFAPIDGTLAIGRGIDDAKDDRNVILLWLVLAAGVKPDITESVAACMKSGGGIPFDAGRPFDLDPNGELFSGGDHITLVAHTAGTYIKKFGEYTVIGKNRNR